MRVLTVNWTDSVGSTAKLIQDIELYADSDIEFYHAYQVGSVSKDRNFRLASWNITRFYYLWARIIGVKYGVGTLPTIRFLKYIRKIKPDIVHIHCPNFYNLNLYMLLNYLKKESIVTVVTNHAEFFYTGNCAHALECKGYLAGCRKCHKVFDTKHRYLLNRTHEEWKRMKNAFADAQTFCHTVVSTWQMNRIKNSPIAQGLPVFLIENGVNEKIFYKKMVANKYVGKYGTRNIVLHVTSRFSLRKNDLKGGYYVIKVAEKLPQHAFLIAGNYDLDKKDILPSNVHLLGNISDQRELANYYNMADLTILTSKRETFGMACAESMMCGTPVVGFKAGGTETIALKDFSEFVEFGDYDRLIQLVNKWIGRKKFLTDELIEKALDRYSVKKMSRKYCELYNAMKNSSNS